MRSREEQDTHVSSVFVGAGFDAVWERITDPLQFPELYPTWTEAVEAIAPDTYRGRGPEGEEFDIRPTLDRELGVVDFEVQAGGAVERSSTSPSGGKASTTTAGTPTGRGRTPTSTG